MIRKGLELGLEDFIINFKKSDQKFKLSAAHVVTKNLLTVSLAGPYNLF
jgi:hypothetical protein